MASPITMLFLYPFRKCLHYGVVLLDFYKGFTKRVTTGLYKGD